MNPATSSLSKVVTTQWVPLILRPNLNRHHQAKAHTKRLSQLVLCHWLPFSLLQWACQVWILDLKQKTRWSKKWTRWVKLSSHSGLTRQRNAQRDNLFSQMALARLVNSSLSQTMMELSASSQSVPKNRSFSSTDPAWNASHTPNPDQGEEVVTILSADQDNRSDLMGSVKIAQISREALSVQSLAKSQSVKIDPRSPN